MLCRCFVRSVAVPKQPRQLLCKDWQWHVETREDDLTPFNNDIEVRCVSSRAFSFTHNKFIFKTDLKSCNFLTCYDNNIISTRD